jgi:hypothetical protein
VLLGPPADDAISVSLTDVRCAGVSGRCSIGALSVMWSAPTTSAIWACRGRAASVAARFWPESTSCSSTFSKGSFEFGVELKLLDYDPQRGVERQKLMAQLS